jgi:hypothetical protein
LVFQYNKSAEQVPAKFNDVKQEVAYKATEYQEKVNHHYYQNNCAKSDDYPFDGVNYFIHLIPLLT